jgi:hypothetical protein
MSEQRLITRREMLRKTLTLSLGATAGAAVAAACKGGPKQLVCTDTVGLAPIDISTRTALEYVDVSTDPKKVCSGCAQWVAPANAETCGGCKMFKGPINPRGFCKGWTAPAPSSG